MDGEDMVPSYKQISRNEAKKMMEQDDGHVIVDVRRPDEFAAGHIPEAICIPNENIGTEKPEELPDLEQVILVYCRSGNRSKQAAQNRCDRYCERVHSKCSQFIHSTSMVTGTSVWINWMCDILKKCAFRMFGSGFLLWCNKMI